MIHPQIFSLRAPSLSRVLRAVPSPPDMLIDLKGLFFLLLFGSSVVPKLSLFLLVARKTSQEQRVLRLFFYPG